MRDEADEDYKNPATFSVLWARAAEENFWSAWAGDFGELLTIHSTSERMGKYTATLPSSNKPGAETYVGTCIVDF